MTLYKVRRCFVLDLEGRPISERLTDQPARPVEASYITWTTSADIDEDEALDTIRAAYVWYRTTRPEGLSSFAGRTMSLDRLGSPELRQTSRSFPHYGARAPEAALKALAKLNEARTLQEQQAAAETLCAAYAVDRLRETRPVVRIRRGPDPEASLSTTCPEHHLGPTPTIYRHLPDGTTLKPPMMLVADLVHLVGHVLDTEWLVPGEPVHDLGFLRRSTHMFRSLGTPRIRPPRRQWFHVVAGTRDAGAVVRCERDPRTRHLSIVRRGDRR